VPDEAAALLFEREGAELSVRYLAPRGAPTNGRTPEHAQLAMACAVYAAELLNEESKHGETTTGAPSAADRAERGEG
jgi:hypothetical protein